MRYSLPGAAFGEIEQTLGEHCLLMRGNCQKNGGECHRVTKYTDQMTMREGADNAVIEHDDGGQTFLEGKLPQSNDVPRQENFEYLL